MQFLYRINGGEVSIVSTEAITGHDPAYFATVTDPLLPDGAGLAPPKIHVSGTVRNATAEEIANFAVAQDADEEFAWA
jgi:hypothetical protein